MKTENKIELLKKQLDFLIANDAPYEEVFKLSSKIDRLLIKIYSDKPFDGKKFRVQSCENSISPNTITNM